MGQPFRLKIPLPSIAKFCMEQPCKFVIGLIFTSLTLFFSLFLYTSSHIIIIIIISLIIMIVIFHHIYTG